MIIGTQVSRGRLLVLEIEISDIRFRRWYFWDEYRLIRQTKPSRIILEVFDFERPTETIKRKRLSLDTTVYRVRVRTAYEQK